MEELKNEEYNSIKECKSMYNINLYVKQEVS